jgi:hypothetical protein
MGFQVDVRTLGPTAQFRLIWLTMMIFPMTFKASKSAQSRHLNQVLLIPYWTT